MSAKEGMVSVTKVKESPDQKVGVDLKQDKKGTVYIKKISKNGLFANTELSPDDKILSINGKRIDKDQTLEEYKEATLDNENLEKITIIARKPGTGLSPKSAGEKKVFKKEFKLAADGTPILGDEAMALPDDEEKVQVLCKAKKQKEGQEVGVTFIKVGDKVYVSGISADSIFHPDKQTNDDDEEEEEEGEMGQLEFGDRIASVNDTNFMSYADADYASKLLNKKSSMECILYVEKGWNVLLPGHVDPIHFDPTLVRGGKAYRATQHKKEDSDYESNDDDSEIEEASKASSVEEEEAPKVKKPDLKEVAPPPKDDEPIADDKMWWDM